MLTIDDTAYSARDFEKYDRRFAEIDALTSDELPRIAVCLQDTATWLALCFYCRRSRISVMPIHPTTPFHAAERLARKAGCRYLFFGEMENGIALHVDKQESEDACLIQMSSGTTGNAKCINRSWQSIETELQSYIAHFSKAQTMTPVVACPVTHSYGLICGVMAAIERGQQPLVVTNINPKYLIKVLRGCERPLLYSSPPMLQTLAQLWPKGETLHAAITSGTTMSKQIFEQVSARVDELFQQYGCSEAGCISVNQYTSSNDDIGVAMPHLQLSAGTSADAPEEIVVREKTSTNGALGQCVHTQDLGYIKPNEKGQPSLHFVARQDDTVVVAGLNVYPQDVEEAALRHPDICDAVAFKVDEAFAGQRVRLHYVSEQSLDDAAVQRWCRQHLAQYQVPQQLQQVSTIERLANGKINRKAIAASVQSSDQSTATAVATA